MSLTRRNFLLSSAAVVAGAALPRMPALGDASEFMGLDISAEATATTYFQVITPGMDVLFARKMTAELRSVWDRDFSFFAGQQWHPEQIAAMECDPPAPLDFDHQRRLLHGELRTWQGASIMEEDDEANPHPRP